MGRKTRSLEKVQEYILPVIVERQNGAYFAYSPIWKDCYAQGDSVEEAVSEINMVAQTLIEIYKEEGLKVPLKLDKDEVKVNQVINMPVFVTA
jgi:predicted RNase H-like HicB family nuclease